MKNSLILKKLQFLRTMGFGIMLLSLIILLSLVGTLLPQNRPQSFYAEAFSETLSELILAFGLDRVYTSMLFTLLFSALVVNLLLCSITRLGKVIKSITMHLDVDSMKQIGSYKTLEGQEQQQQLKQIFKAYGAFGLFGYKRKEDIYYSSKNMLGYCGSWLLHLGIMLVILFYIYGQATFYTSDIYGVAGAIADVEGTGFKAAIQSFDVSYREDGSISQYTTELELKDAEGRPLQQGTLNVNNPLSFKGYSFYQTGTGWAADCIAYKSGTPIKSEVILERSAVSIPEENIALALARFYPDFAAGPNGFVTLSDKPNNPVVLYGVYYRNELVKMDIIKPGETADWNEYSFKLDNCRRYTYLKVNKMNGQQGAAFGGMLIILGLMLNFYFKPKAVAIKSTGDRLLVYGRMAQAANKEKEEPIPAKHGWLNDKEEGIDVR